MTSFTNPEITSWKPGEKPYKKSFESGLFLVVHTNGSKYWRFKFRFSGKEKQLALGVFPEVKLREAKVLRDDARRMLRAGQDPSEARKAEKRTQALESATSFEAIAREWVDKQQGGWTPAHTARVLGSLAREIFPILGDRPIAQITAPELLAALRKVEHRGALETAHRVLQRCDRVFRYAIQTGRCERSPGADLKGTIKTRKVTHRAALAESELPEFLRNLEDYDGFDLTRLALKMQVLTFVRPGELRAAEWSEFDLERAEWRIPAERMKMGAAHVVPLSHQAIEALEELKALSGRGRFVFPNVTRPGSVMSENTVLFALYRMGYHGRATGHGFRACASTILNEQGWRPDVIERQLAHVERDKVRAAYHRSEYLEDRRKMMQHWADFLDGLRAGAKVSPIRAGAASAA